MAQALALRAASALDNAQLYDQAGLMVRLDEKNWLKCGSEFFDGKRWWIASAIWDEERPDNPMPPEYLPKVGADKPAAK